MDFEAFMKKLEQKLNSVLFPQNADSTEIARSFNTGAKTMYNYALVAAYEVQAEHNKEAS